MSEAPLRNRPAERLVACPECGEAFVRRGLAAHRRMRHGSGATPASSNGRAADAAAPHPPGPLPGPDLRGALGSLAGMLARIDARLERLEAARARELAESSPDPRALERGISEVLVEISRVKEETNRQLAQWGSRPRTEEQKALESTSFHRLASLRNRQASLLYRLKDLHAAESGDAACL